MSESRSDVQGRTGPGSKSRAWAGLERAWASNYTKPSPQRPTVTGLDFSASYISYKASVLNDSSYPGCKISVIV